MAGVRRSAPWLGKPPRFNRMSAPQLFGRQCCALNQRLEFRPGDLRVNASAETAIGFGYDAIPPYQGVEAENAFGHQLRMLYNDGGLVVNARKDQLVVRQLHVLSHTSFILVPHVAC